MALSQGELEAMSRRELQALAKEHGIKANAKVCAASLFAPAGTLLLSSLVGVDCCGGLAVQRSNTGGQCRAALVHLKFEHVDRALPPRLILAGPQWLAPPLASVVLVGLVWKRAAKLPAKQPCVSGLTRVTLRRLY